MSIPFSALTAEEAAELINNNDTIGFVPAVTHSDHNEHSVQVVITEQGVADLRGKSPTQRANLIIEKCAHPDFRETLRGYAQLEKKGHTHQSLEKAYAMHVQLLKTGDMRGVNW